MNDIVYIAIRMSLVVTPSEETIEKNVLVLKITLQNHPFLCLYITIQPLVLHAPRNEKKKLNIINEIIIDLPFRM